jgi:ATP-dependent Clp protease protease subunit
MVDILVNATGQSVERIATDIDRDYTVRGEHAVTYGLVDEVIEQRRLAGIEPARERSAA